MESVLPSESEPPCGFELCPGEVLIDGSYELDGETLTCQWVSRRNEEIA